MRTLAMIALMLLTVTVAAIYIPELYGKIFLRPVEKTHLFYSPVTERFIYKEKIVGELPPEALEKAEDHHAETAYRDQDGSWYSRVEFEKRLPFIYYKNMELWGLLPLRLGGQDLDKDIIEKNRQVLELKASEIGSHKPEIPLWPLLESEPGQARLVFPENRFRMTTEAMEFVNADTNSVDRELTNRFTEALQDKGFVFPARSVNGKFTILKPYDEGVFLVDAEHHVFHVKRRHGEPAVVKTPIPPDLETRHIKISENRRREYYGLLLAGDGGLHLLTYDNYRLIPLPLRNYDPDSMDFKLILNPLYRTAIFSDAETVWAVAMDTEYRPLARYGHLMSRAQETTAKNIHALIFPFVLHLEQDKGGYLALSVQSGGPVALWGLGGSLVILALLSWLRKKRPPRGHEMLLVALSGIYGLLAINVIEATD